MATNKRIDQLPLYTGDVSGSYLVMNDSSESATYKVTREHLMGGYQSSGTSGTSGTFHSTYCWAHAEQMISVSVNFLK